MSIITESAEHVDREPNAARVDALDASEEVLDMAVLLGLEEAQVEGEPDLIAELIKLYVEDTPRRIAAIRCALAARDVTTLRRAAHGLKGSSASLGARRVAALCDELEALTFANLTHEGDRLLKRLEHEFENTVARMVALQRLL